MTAAIRAVGEPTVRRESECIVGSLTSAYQRGHRRFLRALEMTLGSRCSGGRTGAASVRTETISRSRP